MSIKTNWFVATVVVAFSFQTAFGQLVSTESVPSKPGNDVRALSVETLVDNIDSGTGGLAIDTEGNLYTADFGWRLDGKGKGGHQVFKVDPAGKVELFCGEMRGASGNALDSQGNLFQSSIGGGFISKVTPDGKVSVFSRSGFKNPVGIAIDKQENLFVCNCGGGFISKVTPDGKSSTFSKSNLLKCPNGIVLADDGNFYVANFSNGNVVKIDPEGNASKLATLPGNNNGHLTYFNGSLYVVARTANQIYKVTLDGKATPFIGSGKRGKADGKPLEATLSLPNDISVSPDGKYMYVNEISPIEGDPKILGPTRIRRIKLSQEELKDLPAKKASDDKTSTKKSVGIEQLDWIAGHWDGDAMGGKFEETWNPPKGGEMLGMFKFIKDDKVKFYEILTIVENEGSLVLRLKHFDSALVGWEEKDKSVEFPLVKITDEEARFDGLTFRKINDNEMLISVAVKSEKSELETLRFECHRVKQNSNERSNHSSQRMAIQKVYEIDGVLAKQRDHLPENNSLAFAISSYVLGLDSIDYSQCPDEFAEAYKNHRDAWNDSIAFFKNHDELRGEMHALMEKLRQQDTAVSRELETKLKKVKDTWTEVESIAERHSVK